MSQLSRTQESPVTGSLSPPQTADLVITRARATRQREPERWQ
jgi:hypothetical protein